MTAKILIVDDDPQMRMTLANLLRREGYTTAEADGGVEAITRLKEDVFDLLITDLHMEPMSGMDLLRTVKQTQPDLEAIVVTAFGTVETAVEAMKLKAFDFITKPFQPDEIVLRVRNALEKCRLKEELRRLRVETKTAFGIDSIIGKSDALRRVLNILPRIAQSDSTVLITGESGTGKELIARAVGTESRRANGPFVSVSCAALPEQLLESELFGHAKGAHSTAYTARKGLFEEAHGGTFFLDEIGEAPVAVQVKLLRVLEERSIRRLGENRSIPVDVRLVAATNQNLEELIKAGRFRADLFFRLNVVRLHMPPLRERVDDIPLLTAHFIDKHNRRAERKIAGIERDAMAVLMAYPWPGNVRELQNSIQRMLVIAGGEILTAADLPSEICDSAQRARPRPFGVKDQIRETTAITEKIMIRDALEQNDWNVTRSARALGISRATLQTKMKLYNLRRAKS